MERLKKDELIETYREVYDAVPQEALELDLRVTVKTIQALAKGKPVSPNELARVWGDAARASGVGSCRGGCG